MSKYITTAHNWGDDPCYVPNLTVDGGGAVKTGLVDQHGKDIWRSSEPVGFVTAFKPRVRIKAKTE